jgi:TRAP-type C4-dicarboxylate transport system permease small subunit
LRWLETVPPSGQRKFSPGFEEMSRLSKLVHWIEMAISMIALSTLFLSVLWGVLTRYVTEKPAVWTTELSGILFTWVVLVGAASALRSGQHIRVTLLVDMLPVRAKMLVELAAKVLTIAFLMFVTWLSYQMMLKGASRPSPVLRIPFSFVYLATFLAFLEMSVSSIVRVISSSKETAQHLEAREGEL